MNRVTASKTANMVARTVCVGGPVFLDVIMSGLEHAPLPGQEQWVPLCQVMPGGAANQAVACARLGLPVQLVSYLGVDDAGLMVRSRLRALGIGLDFSSDTPRQSITTSLFFDGDRAMTTFGTNQMPTLDLVPTPAAVLTDLKGMASNLALLRQWRASEEAPWVLADSGWDDSGRWNLADLEVLEVADVFVPNVDEAQLYTRTLRAKDAARFLANRVPNVVVTCGAAGVVAIMEGEEIVLPALPVRVVDTTGAGDTFSAGLTWATLEGLPPRAAVSVACLAAALTVQKPGGSASAPTLNELVQWTNQQQNNIPQDFDLLFLDHIGRNPQ